MKDLFLLYASVLPVYLVGLYIYMKDREKEPVWLLFKLFLSGIASLFLSLFITLVFSIGFPSLLSESINMDLFSLFFRVFLGIALIEEFSKWVFVYNIGFKSREFDHVYDMVVYAVFVSLGFACFENIFYVIDNGLGVAFVRGLLAVPGHACDGVFMGYYLSMSKLCSIHGDEELRKHYKFMSIAVPVLLHGFYDYCLLSGNIIFVILFLFFIIWLYVMTIKKVKKLSVIPSKINTGFCSFCGTRFDGNFCPNCGRRNE